MSPPTAITDYLLNQSVHIIVLFAIVASVCFALRKKTAHVRYLLWLIIIAKCLVPSLLTISFAILPSEPAPAVPIMTEAPLDMAPVLNAPQRIVYAEPIAEPTLFERLAQIPPKTWFVYLWIAGVIIYALVVIAKAVRLNKYLLANRKSISGGVQDEFDGFLEKLPNCYMVKGIAQPFVWGLVKGSIYLPANFIRSTTPAHRKQIISHEAGHVARLDPLVNLLQIIAQTVFFFHPLVWIANRVIRAEREKCCDEIAIAKLNATPRDYGSAIVETLVKEYERAIPIPSMAIAGPIKNIEDRIKTIMNPNKKFYKRPTVIALMSILLVAVVAVPTSFALSKRPAKSPEEFINIDGMRSYEVNRSVADFADGDFSTPQAAYAQINRVYASGKAAGWVRVSRVKSAGKDRKTEPKYAEELRNAQIIEVVAYGDEAVVFSRIGDDLIDARHVVLEKGMWLNAGHEQYEKKTFEEAKQRKLGKISKNQAKAKKADEKVVEAMKDPKQVGRAAMRLFRKLKDADYEKILKNYNKKTGIWKYDGWKNPVMGYYTVHTNYPAFTLWLCKNLKDNPIETITLGKVFAGRKEMYGRTGWPTIKYQLILKDGKALRGRLAFSYFEHNGKDHWQGVGGGIDWHLMDDPFSESAGFEEFTNVDNRLHVTNQKQVTIESRFLLIKPEFLDDIKKNIELELDLPTDSQSSEFLDDDKVNFLMRATQAHANSKVLTSPKVLVADGESATITTAKETPYITGYKESDSGDPTPIIETVESGVRMEILPKITEKGNILLEFEAEITEVIVGKDSMNKDGLPINNFDVETVSIVSNVVVPASGTVMFDGGLMDTEQEDGNVEKRRLLVLVKPSIEKPKIPVANN